MTHERTIPLVVHLAGDGEATCMICNRPMPRPRVIHLVDGGASIAHPDYEYTNPAADLGWYSIGPECARMFPPGWTLSPVEAYRVRCVR